MFASRLVLLLAVALLALPMFPVRGQVPSDLELTSLNLSVSSPLLVRSAFDGSNRLFIGERSGALLVHQAGAGLSIFLDLTASVDTAGEGGLLGVAFHPNYPQNGYFYVSYTSSGTGGPMTLTTVVERFRVSANPDVANPLSGVEILTLAQPRWNHNGGDLHFGPDGYLYLGLGDGGGSAATVNSQNDATLLGTMVRIDPCDTANCSTPYQVPASNPNVGGAGLDEIWSSGLRNPYRFSFDRQTGDLLIADVGQGSREEVNFQSASSSGGDNYGWPCREGDISGTSSCSEASSTRFWSTTTVKETVPSPAATATEVASRACVDCTFSVTTAPAKSSSARSRAPGNGRCRNSLTSPATSLASVRTRRASCISCRTSRFSDSTA